VNAVGAWVLFALGLGIALGAARPLLLASGRALSRRVAEVAGSSPATAPPTPAAAPRRRRARRGADGRASGAALALARAGVALTPGEYLGVRAGAVVVASLAGLASAGPAAAVVGAAVALAVPPWLLGRRAEARLRAMEGQLADALVLVASALHAGYGLAQAFAAAGRETAEPLGPYLLEVHRRHALGQPMEDSLADLAARLGQPDLSLVATAIAVERQVGGSLAEILDGIAATVRERIQLRQRLRAATAQNRLSATILTLLPVGVGLLLFATAPSFVSVLWTTRAGLGILAAIAVLDAAGALWIRRVSRIDV
jgi:tight adherence protein B